MPRFSVLPLLLMLSLLTACDEQPATPVSSPPSADAPAPADEPAQPVPTPQAEPQPVQTPEALPEPGRKAVDDTTLPKPANSAPKPAEKVSSQEKLPPVELDLQLPPELVEQVQPDAPAEEITAPALLPEMFAEKPKEPGPFELNGRLITNERDKDQDYWNSVEGAELQFKFRR